MNQAGTRKPEFRTSNPLGRVLDLIAQNISPRVMGGPGVSVQRVGGQLIVQNTRTRGRGPIASGGGTTIDVVQAIEAPGTGAAAGTIGVKSITLKADLTLSPNFEQTGDRRVVSYYSL